MSYSRLVNRIEVGGKRFTFDVVLGPETSQNEVGDISCHGQVFDATVGPDLASVLEGFSVTMFAYGQTGSGKTHSLIGRPSDPDDAGILPRCLQATFAAIEAAEESVEFELKVSMCEIYCERVNDLLETKKRGLKVREQCGRVYVEGLSHQWGSHAPLTPVISAIRETSCAFSNEETATEFVERQK